MPPAAACKNPSPFTPPPSRREFFGGHSEEDPPVPIPNTEVKLFSADGTAWETVWESRSPPIPYTKARNKLNRLFRAFAFLPRRSPPPASQRLKGGCSFLLSQAAIQAMLLNNLQGLRCRQMHLTAAHPVIRFVRDDFIEYF